MIAPGSTRAIATSALRGVDLVTLCSAWLSAMETEAREKTLATWELYVRAHWAPFFRDAGELASDRRLAAYVAQRLRKAKGVTVAKECSALQSLLRWCARPEVGYIDSAPTVPRPSKSAGTSALPKVRVDLTPELAEGIIAMLPKTVRAKQRGDGPRPCRAVFRVLWETGLRIGTLLRLEVPRDYRRGAAELAIRDEADKVSYGRVVDLTERARFALDSICPERGPIFTECDFRTQLERAALAVGVPAHLAAHVSHHDFRHARTTSMLDSGAPLTGVAYLVGHRQITTTNLYTHARRSEGKRALATVDSGHRSGHGPRSQSLEASTPAAQVLGIAGVSAMGHGGLEPPANGLRAHGASSAPPVLRRIVEAADVSERPQAADSGHRVPLATAVLAALEARGTEHFEARALDVFDLVATMLEADQVKEVRRHA